MNDDWTLRDATLTLNSSTYVSITAYMESTSPCRAASKYLAPRVSQHASHRSRQLPSSSPQQCLRVVFHAAAVAHMQQRTHGVLSLMNIISTDRVVSHQPGTKKIKHLIKAAMGSQRDECSRSGGV
jgi:hypothetical protein